MGKISENDAPCIQTWKFWRHCCCRYGWYSLFVAPIISAGCLLSLYSSFSCDFVKLSVGFSPSNSAWNQTTAHLGLFYIYTGEENGNKYAEHMFEGCELYTEGFEDMFIDGDRTWKVARIMALIAGAASITATLTSWLFILTPLPVSFFWPGLLLPAVLVSFLAEGSKFLMFDTAVCRTSLWNPTGVNSLPQRAESCDLGNTSVFTIISGCIFFIALMFVCLKAPEKRLLDENYGLRYDDDDDNLHAPDIIDVESALSGGDYGSQCSYPRGSDVYVVSESASNADRSLDFESVSGRSARSGRSKTSARNKLQPELKTVRSEASSVHSENSSYNCREHRDGGDGREAKTARRLSDENSRDGVADGSKPYNELLPIEESVSGGFDERMSAAEIAIRRSEQQRISESRVSKIEKMELSSTSESDDLIEQFVSDLNLSFQQDEEEPDGLDDPSSLLNTGTSSD